MFPLGALLDIGGKILDKVFPDPAQAEQAKLKLLEMQQDHCKCGERSDIRYSDRNLFSSTVNTFEMLEIL